MGGGHVDTLQEGEDLVSSRILGAGTAGCGGARALAAACSLRRLSLSGHD